MNFQYNRKIEYLVLLLFFFISSGLLYGQKDKLIYGQIDKARGSEFYHIPIGLCEDYPEETTTMQLIKSDFEFLKREHINLLRISFGWDAIEEEKGKFNWLFWDDFVKMAVDDYGITLVPYICYMPKWNSTGEKDTMFFWNYPPKDYNEFGVFMKQLVSRYKDRIKTWELWNEPDISIYWQGTQKDFAEFIKIGAKGVKEADPNAKVVLGGMAYDPYFLLHMFRDYGLSPFIDIVNCHNYFETWHRHAIEEITTYVNEMHDVIWRYGNNQALWVAEVGYSTFRKGARVSDSYDAYYKYEHTPEYQAVELFKTLALIASTEKVSAITWYELKDLPPSAGVIGDNDNNRYLGVSYSDWSPKPAAKALTFFHDLFSEKYKSIDKNIFTDQPVATDVQVHAFENEDGSVILTAWLRTMEPGRTGNDRSGNVIDERDSKVNIRLNLPVNGQATLYNELGDQKKFDSIEKTKDGIVLKNVDLTGGKIAIIKINK